MDPLLWPGTVHVRVPATSANLGPGFDALGLALTLYDELTVRVATGGVRIDVVGEAADEVPRNATHLVAQAMHAVFQQLGVEVPGLELSCVNRIPHGRGLGSSAAAIVAGMLAARALVTDASAALPDDALLALASRMEGHPDNVAACLLGGLTVAWTEDGTGRALRVTACPAVHPVAVIAPVASSTAHVRGLLPDTVPHADAALAAGRSALLVAALCGATDHGELLAATEDRLHQPYRAPAMPETAALLARLRADGLAAVVSGAGPTLLVLARDHLEVERTTALAPASWRVAALEVALDGASVSRE